MGEIEEQRQLADDIFDCHEALEGVDFLYHSYDEDDHFMRISKALIGLGYHKTEVKTNGDYIRKVCEKSDDELAHDKIIIKSHWEGDQYVSECSAELVHKTFDAYDKAYNANLEWLKQEYKER